METLVPHLLLTYEERHSDATVLLGLGWIVLLPDDPAGMKIQAHNRKASLKQPDAIFPLVNTSSD